MAAYFLDIDGTLTEFHTNTWLPGALDMLRELHHRGDQIILMTMRCDHRDQETIWSPEMTRRTVLEDLAREGIPYRVLFDVDGPRTIVDDNQVKAVQRRQNAPWSGPE